MAERAMAPFADIDQLVVECSACHLRFDSSQGEKLRSDLMAHLWSHASSDREVQDSLSKPQDVRAGR